MSGGITGSDMSDEQLRLMILKHEGLRLFPYKDTVGKLTIGVGRNLDDRGISRDEAMTMLANDIETARLGLIHTYPWFNSLDEVRQSVLVDMTFNMGIGGVSKFILTMEYIKKGEYEKASQEMLRSTWSKQVGSRSIELSEMVRTGKWQA